MEPEGSLPHSQVPATCPYTEPYWSSPYPPHPTSWRFILILSSHLRLVLPSGLFHSGFPTKTLHTLLFSTIRATCPAHIIILYVITRNIFCEEYRSLSFSLCNFLHYPVTLPLSGQHFLLNTLRKNTLSLRSSLNKSDQVSYPYKTRGINTYMNTHTHTHIYIYICVCVCVCVCNTIQLKNTDRRENRKYSLVQNVEN
jgi:hypothetical protein